MGFYGAYHECGSQFAVYVVLWGMKSRRTFASENRDYLTFKNI